MGHSKVRRIIRLSAVTICAVSASLTLSSCIAGVTKSETRTLLYAQDLASIDTQQVPCYTQLKIEASSMNCFEKNLPGWSLNLYKDEKELFDMACVYGTPKGMNLIGQNWKLYGWDDFELDRDLLEAIQKQLGGEIVQVRDYCLE